MLKTPRKNGHNLVNATPKNPKTGVYPPPTIMMWRVSNQKINKTDNGGDYDSYIMFKIDNSWYTRLVSIDIANG